MGPTSVLINKGISILIFLFPSVALTIKDAGSIVFVLLFLFGLFCGLKNSEPFSAGEKRAFLLFILFFLIMSITLFFTEDMSTGLKRLERHFRWLMAIPIYTLFRKYRGIDLIWNYGLILAGVVVGTFGIVQIYFQGGERAWGAYSAILFGDYAILLSFLFLAAVLVLDTTPKQKILYIVLAAFCVFSSILSGARGSWIAVPPTIFFLMWLFRKKLGIKRILFTALSGIVLCTLLFFHPTVNQRLMLIKQDIEAYKNNPNFTTSTGDRINMWNESLIMLKESNYLGVGIGDYKRETENWLESGKSRLPHSFDHAHNIYFDSLATTGIAGFLITLLAIFVYPFFLFYKAWVNEKRLEIQYAALSGMLLIFTFFIFGLTETWTVRNPALNMYIIFLLVFLAKVRNSINDKQPN